MALIGTELVQVTPITAKGRPAATQEQTTTQAIANLAAGGGVTSIIAGVGISVDHATGPVTVTNTGSFSAVRAQAGTTYTFVTADAGKYIQFTDAAPTVTIVADATQPMPANAEINFEATGGTVTVAAAGGVTLNSADGKVASSAQFVALTLKRTTLNVWTLIGSLA